MLIANESGPDRLLRIVLGLLLLAAGWSGLTGGLAAVALKLFGLYPLVTGALGWDPFYSLLGLRTARRRGKR